MFAFLGFVTLGHVSVVPCFYLTSEMLVSVVDLGIRKFVLMLPELTKLIPAWHSKFCETRDVSRYFMPDMHLRLILTVRHFISGKK